MYFPKCIITLFIGTILYFPIPNMNVQFPRNQLYMWKVSIMKSELQNWVSPSGVYKLAEIARAPLSVKTCKQENEHFR